MMLDRKFKMTLKTKMFLWFYSKIHDLSQWFIHHCNYEES